MGTTAGSPRAVAITVVEAPGCHFCADAQEALASLDEQGNPIKVNTLDARSGEGMALMQRHRVTLSPLVLVDGAFFSQGRLPRRKLAHLLERRASGATDSAAERA